MALLVLSYPTLTPDALAWLEGIRSVHDAVFHGIVRPHFTLVFPTTVIAADELVAHARRTTGSVARFGFTCQRTTVVRDALSPRTHVFLVPDEGYSQLIDLHDRLYTGLLAPELRLDIPYTPHITIATDDSAQHCQSLAESLNAREIAIHGTIDALQIVRFENQVITPVEHIALST